VSEGDLLCTLNRLALRQAIAQATLDSSNVIDVVCLSLGYYHEHPDDLSFDPQILVPLRMLSECGVAVTVAAGNDSTARPMFPAAFTPYPGGLIAAPDPRRVPLISVGARNPDGTVAMFSNSGPWVACHRPGAALVSTFPVTFNAAAGPTLRTWVAGEGWRETIDPDDFGGGFGTWSGTSFAAPILAAEIAQTMLDGQGGSLDLIDQPSSVARGWHAVSTQVRIAP